MISKEIIGCGLLMAPGLFAAYNTLGYYRGWNNHHLSGYAGLYLAPVMLISPIAMLLTGNLK